MPPSTRSAKRQTGPTSAPSAGWATFGAVVVACAAVAVSSSWTVLSGGGPLTGAAFLAPLLVTARKCFTLSYSVAPCAPGAEQLYGKGPDDVWLVLTAFTFLLAVQWAFFRWAVVPARWLIQRLAVRTASGAPSSKRAQSPASNRRRVASLQRAGAAPSASVMSGDGAADRFQSADGLNQGDKTHTGTTTNETKLDANCQKFLEQLFLLLYYVCSLSAGYYIYAHSSYYPLYMNSALMWRAYPHALITARVKVYYLVQIAFWIQQLFHYVVIIPRHERRKDHWAMTAHHVITTLLVLSSYVVHFTRVGNMVLVVMDVADVVLCTAKCMKYLGERLAKLCDFVFGVFIVVWVVTRHVIYFYLMWSIHVESRAELGNGRGTWDPWFTRTIVSADDAVRPGTYFSDRTMDVYVVLFVALQCLLLYWLSLILKIVARVVRGGTANDVREDDD